jgi:hypothetical protein
MHLNNGPVNLAGLVVAIAIITGAVGRVPLARQVQRKSNGADQFSNPLSTIARVNITNVPRLDAILQFGQREGLPLGIACVDAPRMTAPVTISAGTEQVAGILDTLLPQSSGYFWKLEGGVVDVSCGKIHSVRTNLLNIVLHRIFIPKSDLSSAGHSVFMALYARLHPGEGIAGDFMPERSKARVGPMVLHDVTVREALNRIVSAGPKGVWVARVPPRYLGDLPPAGLWVVVAYDDPDFMATAEYVRKGLAIYPQVPQKSPSIDRR